MRRAQRNYSFTSPVEKQILRGKGKIFGTNGKVENKVHYILGVSYNEDKYRVRKDHGAENFSILRRASQMIKLEKAKKN